MPPSITSGDIRPLLLFGGMAWETIAVASRGRVPTITECCWRWRSHPVGFTVIAATLALAAHHLLIEEGNHRWQATMTTGAAP